MPLQEFPTEEFVCHPFTAFDKDWALVTAGTEGHLNTMTVSWGGVGTLWGRPVATVYVRQSRYTKEFLDDNDTFSVSFLPAELRRDLAYLGAHSGRDGDKVAAVGLTPALVAGTPTFEEASLALVCRKAYVGPLAREGFVDPTVDPRMYPDGDYHTIYIGYVERALRRI